MGKAEEDSDLVDNGFRRRRKKKKKKKKKKKIESSINVPEKTFDGFDVSVEFTVSVESAIRSRDSIRADLLREESKLRDILRRMELETDLEVFEHEKSRQERSVATYRRALDLSESKL